MSSYKTIRLFEDLYKRLKAVSDKKNMKLSDYIHFVLEKHLREIGSLCIAILMGINVGCSSLSTYQDENGKEVHTVSCNGAMRTIGWCYESADKECDGKYFVLRESIGDSLFQPRSLTFYCGGVDDYSKKKITLEEWKKGLVPKAKHLKETKQNLNRLENKSEEIKKIQMEAKMLSIKLQEINRISDPVKRLRELKEFSKKSDNLSKRMEEIKGVSNDN